MSRPRVLLVLANSTGGIGRHVRSIVDGLREAGIPVAVAGPMATDLHFDFRTAGAVFHPVEIPASPRPADVGAVRSLAEVVRIWRPTVVHAHGLRAGAVAVGARPRRARDRRAGLVISWHNAPVLAGRRRLLQRGLETLVARGADLTLGASADLVERARALGARDARLLEVAAPPLPPPARTREDVRNELATGDRPLLLAVGRLAPQKDYPTMLAAARAWGDAVLAIAGDGPLRGDLSSAAQGLPVRLLGARDDVADLLAAADAVVLSSTWEARALVAQEALRAGVPLVATSVGGIPELVGDAALLVPPGDPDALAAAVRRVLNEPGLAGALAAAGPERAAGWPTEEDTRRRLVGLYREWHGGPVVPIP